MKSKNGLKIGLALVLAGALFAGCEDDSSVFTNYSDTLAITIFGSTLSMTETASSNAVGFDPFITIAVDTNPGIIKLNASKDLTAPNTIGNFVTIELPINTTIGSYTIADSAFLAYVENFDVPNGTFDLVYISDSDIAITVTSAGAVGSRWEGTFDTGMVDSSGGGGAATRATGSFSVIRDEDSDF